MSNVKNFTRQLSPFQVAIVDAIDPETIGKHFALNGDELRPRKSAGNLKDGSWCLEDVTDMHDYRELVQDFGPETAVTVGIPVTDADKGRITGQWIPKEGPEHIYRTADDWQWQAGPAIMPFDLDPDSYELAACAGPMRDLLETDITPDDLDEVFRSVFPWWGGVPVFIQNSNSSGIYHARTGERLSRKRGRHMALPVSDGRLIPLLVSHMAYELVKAGFAFCPIHGTGRAPLRPLIDVMVYQPGRFMFEGSPGLGKGLEWRSDARVFDGDTPMLDIAALDLKARDWQKAPGSAALIKEAEADPRRRDIEKAYKAGRMVDLEARGMSRGQARQAVENALGAELFDPEWTLTDGRVNFTAGDVLANPAKYDDMHICDPLEPDYNDFHLCAVIWSDRENPIIVSQAHGPTTYHLKPDRAMQGLADLRRLVNAEKQGGEDDAPNWSEDTYSVAQAALKALVKSGLIDKEPAKYAEHLEAIVSRAKDHKVELNKVVSGRTKLIDQMLKVAKAELEKEEADERREAEGDFKDDGTLNLSPDIPFNVNLKRATERFAVLEEGAGLGVHVADLTCIGTKGWARPFAKVAGRYANIFIKTEDGPLPLMQAFLHSPYRRAATSTVFRPGEREGYIEIDGRDGVIDGAINIYSRPNHPRKGGATETFHRFMAHLLPIEAERERFMLKRAYKVQHPEWRGAATIMVAADTYGTGRGTEKKIFSKVLGEKYVKTIAFADFCGRTTPGQWNDWQENILVTYIAEVRDGEQSGAYYDKEKAYEEIKRKCDPGENRLSITKRNTSTYDANVYDSLEMSTNHYDALHMPVGDRRCDVFSNGERLAEDLRDDINAWMEDPKNIGALHRELMAMDTRAFDPYGDPPMTDAKQRMIEASQSAEESACSEFMEIAAENGVELITRSMMEDYIMRRVRELGTGTLRDGQSQDRIRAVIKPYVHGLPRGHDRAGSEKSRQVCAVLNSAHKDKWGPQATNKGRTTELEISRRIFDENEKASENGLRVISNKKKRG